jgi:lipopolysaccharide export system protein LptC
MATGPLPSQEPPADETPAVGGNASVGWLKHRRLVALLRIALPMAALLLATLVIVWPKFQNRDRSGFTLAPTRIDPREIEQTTMVNPRFVGMDVRQQPYTITAKSATQDKAGSDLILLDQPQADLSQKTGAWITITANSGRYQQKAQLLDLAGDISLFHDAGYEFHTEQAQIDFATDNVNGDAPVTGQGPLGTIDAQGFMILDHGQTVIFTGKSKLHLNPGHQSAAGNQSRRPQPAGKAK